MKLYGRELQSSLACYIKNAEEATKTLEPLTQELSLLRGCLSAAVEVLDSIKKQSDSIEDVSKRPFGLEMSMIDKMFSYTKTIAEVCEKVHKINKENTLNPEHVIMLVQQILLILNQHVDKNTLAIVNTKLQRVLIPFSDNSVRPLPLILESVE